MTVAYSEIQHLADPDTGEPLCRHEESEREWR